MFVGFSWRNSPYHWPSTIHRGEVFNLTKFVPLSPIIPFTFFLSLICFVMGVLCYLSWILLFILLLILNIIFQVFIWLSIDQRFSCVLSASTMCSMNFMASRVFMNTSNICVHKHTQFVKEIYGSLHASLLL